MSGLIDVDGGLWNREVEMADPKGAKAVSSSVRQSGKSGDDAQCRFRWCPVPLLVLPPSASRNSRSALPLPPLPSFYSTAALHMNVLLSSFRVAY